MKFLKATEQLSEMRLELVFSVQCLCPDAQERADGGTRTLFGHVFIYWNSWLFSYVQTQESKDRQTGNFL